MARKKKVDVTLLRCSECGNAWTKPCRREYYETHCPYCEANHARVLLSLLQRNYAIPRNLRFCTRCHQLHNELDGCPNCGNPEFACYNLKIMLGDCWYEPKTALSEIDEPSEPAA